MQKTLEKLKRSELFELLVEQAKEIESYQAKLVDLEKRIEYREAVLGEIGSIAEASLAVTRILKKHNWLQIFILNKFKSYT